MATKYPKAAQTGELGAAIVKQIVAEAGGIFRPFESSDLGIDGTIELLTDQHEPSGDLVLVQIKCGRSFVRGHRFHLVADRAHFETWARYAVPVVGIVCDPVTRRARWADISEHLRRFPEAIASGPYSIEAPASQPFSVDAFAAFVARFRRPAAGATRVDVTPNLLIRPWEPGDAGPTRVLLAPIAADYPGFDGWLAKKLADPRASKKVVAIGSTIAAFSMWQAKDDRTVKLQTFIVGPLYRGTAIGQHLLYHELRTWAEAPNLARVHVTVAATKTDLIAYFREFGFRVEGFVPNRYRRATGAAELVMAKHFLRSTVRSVADLQALVSELSRKIWGLGAAGGRFGVDATDLAVPGSLPALSVELEESERTVSPRLRLLDPAGQEILRHDDASLMTELFPLRIHLPGKRYVLVPIYRDWVDAMLSDSGSRTSLKLRTDNAYYCYPKMHDLARGDLVAFYEPQKGGGRGAAIGAAVVLDAEINTPQALHHRFSDLGIYELANVQAHADRRGRAMALRFGLFEPFRQAVPLARIRAILGQPNNVQGLTPIPRDAFERIRTEGIA
jgi:ribosomal protein S18 acetylase RimI-like enzyme